MDNINPHISHHIWDYPKKLLYMIMLLKQVLKLVTESWSLFSESLSSLPLSTSKLVLQFVLDAFYHMNISLLRGNLHKSLHNKYIIIFLKRQYIKYNITILGSSGNSHLTNYHYLSWLMDDIIDTIDVIEEVVIEFSFLLLILCLWSSWNILHCTKHY